MIIKRLLLFTEAVTEFGKPLFKTVCLAGFWPHAAVSAWPIITSSGKVLFVWFNICFSTNEPNSWAERDDNDPLNEPFFICICFDYIFII